MEIDSNELPNGKPENEVSGRKEIIGIQITACLFLKSFQKYPLFLKDVLKKLLLSMSGPYKIRARELPERKISNY